MKKINSVVLSTLTAAILVGCGGGSSSSSSGTDVTVERGPLYSALVTDADGQVAKDDGTNVYTFEKSPKYPIKAVGGINDSGSDGLGVGVDVKLDDTVELTSYSEVITPITTYLGDTSTTEGKEKLKKLKEILKDSKLTDDDLIKKVPSKVSDKSNAKALADAIFMNIEAKKNSETKEFEIADIETKLEERAEIKSQFPDKSDEELESYIMQEVLKIQAASTTDIELAKAVVLEKSMFSNKTFKFTADIGSSVLSLNSDGTGTEVGTEDGKEYTDNIKWSIHGDTNRELKLEFTDKTIDLYSFKAKPANGVKANLLTDEMFEVTISEFKDIVAPVVSTDSTKLKIADLSRFVSYEEGEDWYDDNTVSDGKIMFESYSNYDEEGFELEDEDEYVTFKADASNAYKAIWTDPMTKEEGTFTILKTEKVTSFEGNTYTDLYKTEVIIEITKQAASPFWDRWDWENPTYAIGTSINDINSLIAAFTRENSDTTLYTHSDEYDDIMLKSNGDVVKADRSGEHRTRSTTKVGTWVKSGEQINITLNNKERRYIRVVKDGANYYIETGEAYAVGYIDEEIIFTGSDLDKLIANIKLGSKADTVQVDETTTPNETPAITSFVSGKKVVLSDYEGSVTTIFNADGSYEEIGSFWSCYGMWKDFGNGKIGFTCDDNSTKYIPDGIVDDNEKTAIFYSTSPKAGDQVKVSDVDESYDMKIDSITNL